MRAQVFERGAHARLTPIGERVVAAARAALAELARVEASAAAGKPPFFGPVRLGVIPTVGPYALPLIAPALERAFPDLELPIHEGQTAQLLELLDKSRLDVLLLAELPGMAAGRELLALCEEPFLIALPAKHPLATRERIAAADLAKERLLLLDEGHCLRDQAVELCRLRDQSEHRGADYRAASLETLRQLVALGVGCTVLPALAAAYGGEDLRIVVRPLAMRRGSRTLVLAWRTGDARADAYRSLAPVMRRALPKGSIKSR
jgi:LysR family hydrogen peroxide-inducible transcriptional activator